MRALVFLLVLLFSATACLPTRDLRRFTLYRETSGVDPRLNIKGIYYRIDSAVNSPERGYDLIRGFVLYENGTLLILRGSGLTSTVALAVKRMLQGFQQYKSDISNRWMDYWGAYKIKDDRALLVQLNESWVYSKFGVLLYTSRVENRQANIINDTTILLPKEGGGWNGWCSTGTYHLFKTNDKPDSIYLYYSKPRIKRKLDRLYDKRHHATARIR